MLVILESKSGKDKSSKGKSSKGKSSKGKSSKGKSSKGKSSKSKSSKSKSSKGSKTKTKETKITPLPDISFWINLLNLRQHIEHVMIVMKKSKFLSKVRVTSIDGKKSDIVDQKKDTKKTITNESHIIYNSTTYHNQPLYYFSDSLYRSSLFIFLYLTGDVTVLRKLQMFSSPDKNKNEKICNIRTCSFHHPYLYNEEEIILLTPTVDDTCKYAVNKYNWQDVVIGDAVIADEVCSKSGKVQDVSEGRNIYSIYVNSTVAYVVDLMSDIPITVGNEEQLLQRIGTDPERFIDYCRNVANAFGKLIQNFSTTEYVNSMRNFTNALAYNVSLTKRQRMNVLKAFCDELCSELEKMHGQEDPYNVLFSLKVLFLDPTLRCVTKATEVTYVKTSELINICECSLNLSDTKLNIKMNELSAVMIQSHVRQFLVRNLLRYHDETYQKHFNVITSFKKIYDSIFSIKNRYVILKTIILRMFHSNERMNNVKYAYHLYKDLQNYLQYKILNGTLNVFNNEWYMILRCVVYVKYDIELRLLIRFISDKEFNYIIKINNNDTMDVFEFTTNDISSYSCKPNVKGYTILVTGRAVKTVQLDWKLYVGHVKLHDESLIDVDYTHPIQSNRIIYSYIPNCNDFICRWDNLQRKFLLFAN